MCVRQGNWGLVEVLRRFEPACRRHREVFLINPGPLENFVGNAIGRRRY